MYCMNIFMSKFKLKAVRFFVGIRYPLFAVLLLAVFILSVRYGSAKMSLSEFFGGLFSLGGFETERIIIYNVRMPRVLAAMVGGIGLSLSGSVLQAVTGNDLAAPSIIGINSGAGLGAMIFLSFAPTVSHIGGSLLLQMFSFFGAFLTTIIVITLSEKAGGGKASIVLAGVAINAVFNAFISAISLIDTEVLPSYNSFSIGGFASCEYKDIIIPAVIIVISLLISICLSRYVNLMSLGVGGAHILGVNVRAVRIVCIILASASAASAVSFAGLIGFVGLVVPHITKKIVGTGFCRVVTMSTLLGATITALADLLGRVLLSPTEIPVGITMALIGAPLFITLLYRGRREYL